MRQRNSEAVPGVLVKALRQIQAQKTSQVHAPVIATKRKAGRLPVRVAGLGAFTPHGAGVYEEKKTGDLWYREGEFLVRQAVNTDEIVNNYLETLK